MEYRYRVWREEGRRGLLGARWVIGLAVLAAGAPLWAGEPKRISQAEAMAAAVSKTHPEYSPIAKQLRLAGAVEMEVTISEDGSVEDVKTLSGNPVLAKSAAAALKKWKFTPFQADGKPVKAVSTIAINFKPV
jgi:TonB family protein